MDGEWQEVRDGSLFLITLASKIGGMMASKKGARWNMGLVVGGRRHI